MNVEKLELEVKDAIKHLLPVIVKIEHDGVHRPTLLIVSDVFALMWMHERHTIIDTVFESRKLLADCDFSLQLYTTDEFADEREEETTKVWKANNSKFALRLQIQELKEENEVLLKQLEEQKYIATSEYFGCQLRLGTKIIILENENEILKSRIEELSK